MNCEKKMASQHKKNGAAGWWMRAGKMVEGSQLEPIQLEEYHWVNVLHMSVGPD